MDFTKTFDMKDLENGLRKGHPIGPAIVGVMENTSAWKNHTKKCAVAKVVSIGIDGQKLNIDELARRQIVLDHKEWRDDATEFAQSMIEGDRNRLLGINNEAPESVAQSQNFSISANTQIYEKQNQHNIGCMCGVEVSVGASEVLGLKANNYGVVSSMNGSDVSRRPNSSYAVSESNSRTYKT